MKKIGIIGGLGPEATIDYYKRIIDCFKSGNNDMNYPEILIYSVNMSEFLEMMERKQDEQIVSYFVNIIESLKKSGADFAAISSNTPHQYFNEISKRSPIPLISIVKSACDEVLQLNLKKPGLFGTGYTMNANFYQKVFNQHGLDVLLPELSDKETINQKLFSEIELGVFNNGTRQILINIIEKMVQKQNIDCLILGCTELPLILTDKEYAGIPMINTTQIHINSITRFCLTK